MNITTLNGVIESFSFKEQENHFTLNLNLKLQDYGNVTFGGISLGMLDSPLIDNGSNYMQWYISQIFSTLNITDLSQLCNLPCRVIINSDESLCIGIQNFLRSNKVFVPRLISTPDLDLSPIFPEPIREIYQKLNKKEFSRIQDVFSKKIDQIENKLTVNDEFEEPN